MKIHKADIVILDLTANPLDTYAEIPEDYEPFAVKGPLPTGDQRRDAFGPWTFQVWSYSRD